MRIDTYEDWKEVFKKPGAWATVRSLDWLLKGCPKCGCQEWDITNDGWCYCQGCHKGYSTDGIWTNLPLSFYDKSGFHCFMCKGYGEIHGKICDECHGRVTQKEQQP